MTSSDSARGHLVLSVEADASLVPLHAPVGLSITARNAGDGPLDGRLILDPECGLLRVFVTSRGREKELSYIGSRKRVLPNGAVMYANPECGRTKLAPQEEFRVDLVLAVDPETEAFVVGSPGQHTFVVRYSLGGRVISSNEAVVLAEMPTAGEHDAFLAYTQGLAEVAQLRTYRTDVPAATLSTASSFLKRHPESSYARFLRDGLRAAILSRGAAASPEEKAILAEQEN
jgi:hypothetical protein